MKTAVLLLVFGAALSLPQNFYWPITPRNFEQDNVYQYPRPVTIPRLQYNQVPYVRAGYPVYYDEDYQSESELEADQPGALQYSPWGVHARQGFFNNILQPAATLYSYTATVPVTATQTVTSVCIPKDSFSIDGDKTLTDPCAARRRRGIWDQSELEESIISPSHVEEVEPTIVRELSSSERAGDVDIVSSKETQQDSQDEETNLSRQKRLFGAIIRQLRTVIVRTDFKLTVFAAPVTSFSTYKDKKDFICLPPGTAVCA